MGGERNVLVIYTGMDAPDGVEKYVTEHQAKSLLRSPQYRLHATVLPEVQQRVLPPPVTADELYNHLFRQYLSLCNCLSTKGKRDQLRAELATLKAMRARERAQGSSLKELEGVPARIGDAL